MNGEGSHTDRDTTAKVEDNVIRLTDWLGPREELIPFGPGADAEEAARASRAKATGTLPTAEDFWSESSAAVQDALTAPHGDDDTLVTRGEHRRPASRSFTRSGRASAAAVWAQRRALLRSRAEATGNQRRLRSVPLLGLLLVILIATPVLALSSGILWSGPRRPATIAHGDHTSALSASDRTAELAAASHDPGHQAPRRASGQSATHRGPAVNRPRVHRRPLHHNAAPASVALAQPAGYTTPAPASSSSSTASSGSSSGTARMTPTSSSTTRVVATGGQKSSSAQPALGANGSLAPGSSPDG